jgi:hypothetical protein
MEAKKEKKGRKRTRRKRRKRIEVSGEKGNYEEFGKW